MVYFFDFLYQLHNKNLMNQEEDTLLKKLSSLKKDLSKLVKLEGKKGDKCFFHDCSNQAIKSHSLSESRVLSLLERKNEKGQVVVYHIDDVPDVDFKDELSLSTFHKTNRRLFEKGKSDTSVFYGFCKDCDRETFRLVDNHPYLNNKEINFSHSLRTTAYTLTYHRNLYTDFKNKVLPAIIEVKGGFQELNKELNHLDSIFTDLPDTYDVSFEKAKEFKSILETLNTTPLQKQREEIDNLLLTFFSVLFNESRYPMKGYLFKQEIMRIKPIFESTKKDFKELQLNNLSEEIDEKILKYERATQSLTSLYRDKSFSAYRYLTISIDGIYLIAGAFNYSSHEQTNISLTFFPETESNKTHFLFSGHINEDNIKYFSQLNIMSIPDFKMRVTEIILSQGTNVFISPDFWRKIPNKIQALMLSDKGKIVSENFSFFDLVCDLVATEE